MNRVIFPAIAIVIGGLMPAMTYASLAETSASARSGRYGRPGTADATAHYQGDIGLARTHTKSGDINIARGIAVGVDEDGASLSLSYALAPDRGPGIGGTFNLSVDRDGRTSGGHGHVLAEGGRQRQVEVSGATRTGYGRPHTTIRAGGHTRGGGRVEARTRTYGGDRREIRRVGPVRRYLRHR
jgi:hypothetical protein